jgi:hypothetical protein
MTILYTHRMDLGNPGDMWSCPVNYVSSTLKGSLSDIYQAHQPNIPRSSTLIVGGGGLFYERNNVDKVLRYLSRVARAKLIIWGVGSSPGVADDLFRRADLVGIRQRYDDSTWAWCPCASALYPGIDARRKIKPTKNFLVVDHWKRKPIQIPVLEVTRTKNNPATIDQILDLIVDHDYVITGSYHVWYWATLLQRRVVVCADAKAIQKKFAWLPYPTPMAEKFSWQLLDQAAVYPGARDECIGVNRDFAQQVDRLVNS